MAGGDSNPLTYQRRTCNARLPASDRGRLEDGSGHHGDASFILQPVLQYGKSGCVLDPLKWHSWHFIAFLVDGSGRAHCGSTLQVEEGETLVGNMTLQNTAAEQTWEVLT